MTVTVKPDELREAGARIEASGSWTDVPLSVAKGALAFRLLANIISEPPDGVHSQLERAIANRDSLKELADDLAAEKTELIRQLIAARQQCEFLLATIGAAYDNVRAEQERDSLERMSKVDHPMEGNL